MSMQEEFDVLLNAFNKVIKDSPAVSKVKVELEDLIKAVEGSPTLNIRKKDAIIARCEN